MAWTPSYFPVNKLWVDLLGCYFGPHKLGLSKDNISAKNGYFSVREIKKKRWVPLMAGLLWML